MCTAGKAFAGAAIAKDVSTSRSTLAVRIIDLVRSECPSVMTTTGRRNMHILDRTGSAWDVFRRRWRSCNNERCSRSHHSERAKSTRGGWRRLHVDHQRRLNPAAVFPLRRKTRHRTSNGIGSEVPTCTALRTSTSLTRHFKRCHRHGDSGVQ